MEKMKPKEQACEMYELRAGDEVLAYAYGPEWVAQALFMDDWPKSKTEQEARAVWSRYLEYEERRAKK